MPKGHLQSLFLVNRTKVRNRRRGSIELGLVDWQPKRSSNKACLYILRAEDIRQVRVRQSTEQDDKAGTKKDNKVDIGQ